jgi:hypothetical protein
MMDFTNYRINHGYLLKTLLDKTYDANIKQELVRAVGNYDNSTCYFEEPYIVLHFHGEKLYFHPFTYTRVMVSF